MYALLACVTFATLTSHASDQILIDFISLSFSVDNVPEISATDASELRPLSPNKIDTLEIMLNNMKKDQAYLGLIENLDWVLEKSLDKSNTFNDACGFVRFIVANNLYTEGYCLSLGDN